MNPFLVISIALVAYDSAFSQCPQPGIKIQTSLCESPKDLKVNSIISSALQAKWKGNKNQTYVVKATYTDPGSNNIFQTEIAQSSCDNAGSCAATIPVKAGAKVNWSVQSICAEKGTILYSYKQDGEEVEIPVSQKLAEKTTNDIRAYPNPTTGYLTVEYLGKVAGNIEFTIFDLNGKKVFNKWDAAVSKSGIFYKLNLRALVSGAYLLQVRNGTKISLAKIVLFRN